MPYFHRPQTQLHISIEPYNSDCLILSLEGELDLQTSDQLDQTLNEWFLAGFRFFILECSRLEYIDSTGIGKILKWFKKLALEGGNLLLCSLQPSVKHIFKHSRLHSLLNIFVDLKTAKLHLYDPTPKLFLKRLKIR